MSLETLAATQSSLVSGPRAPLSPWCVCVCVCVSVDVGANLPHAHISGDTEDDTLD